MTARRGMAEEGARSPPGDGSPTREPDHRQETGHQGEDQITASRRVTEEDQITARSRITGGGSRITAS